MIEVIAFDADDTLWHSETLFAVTHERFAALLAPYADPATLSDRLLATERDNLDVFGYGVKGFTLAMVETAIAVSDQRVAAADLAVILDWGKQMLRHPVEFIEGAEETVRVLAESHRLALVTKGDLFHQESKLAASGLGDLFDHVAVVSEKDAATYRRITTAMGVEPAGFLMVGNSVRSDVIPVLEIGGKAVHIPYQITWVLEVAPAPSSRGDDYWELEDIRQLPGLVAELNGR